MNTCTDWYWGELRSAMGVQDLERVWALLAAWPGGPDQKEARRYVLKAGADLADPDLIPQTAWMLEYYRTLPVPTAASSEPNRLCLPWRGQVQRGPTSLLAGHRAQDPRAAIVTEDGLNAALGLKFSCGPDGGPAARVQVLMVLPPAPGQDPPPDHPPAYEATAPGYPYEADPEYEFWGVLQLRGEEGLKRGARLFRKVSRELEALAEGEAELSWPDDLVEKLNQEGSDLHPDLTFTPQGAESRVPASALREAVMTGEVGRLAEHKSLSPLQGASPSVMAAHQALQDLGSDLGVPQALYLLGRDLPSVLREAGCSEDSHAGRAQARRLREAEAVRPLLEEVLRQQLEIRQRYRR